MLQGGNLDVSIILPFGDHEDVIGTAVQRLAAYLDERGLAFEILALDLDSGDNSHAVLALVRSGDPRLAHSLEILTAPPRGRHRGYELGVRRACGRVLWLLEPHDAMGDLGAFDRAYEQVVEGARDVVVHPHRFAVAHRTRSGPALVGLKGTGRDFYRRLMQQARTRGLAVEPEVGQGRKSRRLSRFLAALSHGLNY